MLKQLGVAILVRGPGSPCVGGALPWTRAAYKGGGKPWGRPIASVRAWMDGMAGASAWSCRRSDVACWGAAQYAGVAVVVAGGESKTTEVGGRRAVATVVACMFAVFHFRTPLHIFNFIRKKYNECIHITRRIFVRRKFVARDAGHTSPRTKSSQVKSAPTPVSEPNVRAEVEKKTKQWQNTRQNAQWKLKPASRVSCLSIGAC